jgi:hypothetical protein
MTLRKTGSRMLFAGIVVAASANAPFFRALAVEAEPPYSVLVSASEARVVFPMAELDTWEWCLPETRQLDLEYSWTATVANGEQGYTFGFFLFKCLRSGPTRGAFDMLLRAGQMGVTELHSSGGGGRFMKDVKVATVTSAARLTLVVRDARTLRLLFSERPVQATLRAQLPGEPNVIREVPITYSQP